LVPDAFEFWQNRDDRLHDRLRYTAANGAWSIDRLQP
jgi:pyridoxamine 5'-phosphate oxidase